MQAQVANRVLRQAAGFTKGIKLILQFSKLLDIEIFNSRTTKFCVSVGASAPLIDTKVCGTRIKIML